MNKLNEKGASSWDLVLKILSITLVSLFAFSSGVWFGKKLSDSDYQRQALEGEFDKEVRKTASAGGLDSKSDSADEASAGHDSEALTDEEVMAAADKALQSTKDQKESPKEEPKVASKDTAHGSNEHADNHEGAKEVAKAAPAKAEATKTEKGRSVASTAAASASESNAHSASNAHSTAAPAEKITEKKPDLSAVHQAAARVASNAAPVAKEAPKQESRIPSSLPKTVGASNDVEFTVQVASYPTAEAAKEHVDSLVKKGFPAFPVEAKINGKVWYRVSVGSFKTFNDASKYRAQLLKQSDLPSAIVSKIAR